MISIYLLTNTKNGKLYVGQTNNLRKRLREHSYASNDCSISKAIRKHGWSVFTSVLLEECQDEFANEREAQYITVYNSKKNGYNETDGGKGLRGFAVSEETKAKQRAAKIGRKLSAEHSKKISESNLGRKVSPETRQRISSALLGKSRIGHPISEEHRAKISESLSGKAKTPEHRAALSRAKSGKQWSEAMRTANKVTDEKRLLLSERKAKTYVLTSPSGVRTTITNMSKFCKLNSIAAPSAMIDVYTGKRPQYLGWTR